MSQHKQNASPSNSACVGGGGDGVEEGVEEGMEEGECGEEVGF